MTALYRAYRPQTFDDVMGQDRAVKTLRNAITSDRVAHAYLFTGTKGTGKTTLAKLLAKAMNCEKGPTPDPCGTCESCVSIAEGRSIDVAEIDAASNTGIDAVRERIIKTVSFQPAQGTRRVYILDEAHQLSTSAFNSLLKTIEEPPPHALFIFCTTESHKMMATVRDRCQRIVLAPPTPDVLLEVLTRVAATEKIEADEAALATLVRSAQGSFRNALGLLEMMSTAFDRSFDRADVLAHLGTFGEEVIDALAGAVIRQDTAGALQQIEDLIDSGADLEQLTVELAGHMRTLLLVRHGIDSALAGAANADALREQAAAADDNHLLAAIDCLNDTLTRVRVGADPRISLESAIARASQGLGLPSLALRLAVLEHKLSGGAGYGAPLPASAATASQAAPQAAVEQAPAAAQPEPAAVPAAQPAAAQPAAAQPAPQSTPVPESVPEPAPAPAAQPAAPGPASGDYDLAAVGEWWPSVLGVMRDHGLKAALLNARPEAVGANLLRFTSPTATLLNDTRQRQIAAAVKHVTGLEVRVEIEQLAPQSADEVSLPHADPDIAPPSYDEADLVDADEHERLQREAAVAAGARSMPATRSAGETAPVGAGGAHEASEAVGAPNDRLDLFQTTFNATEIADT